MQIKRLCSDGQGKRGLHIGATRLGRKRGPGKVWKKKIPWFYATDNRSAAYPFILCPFISTNLSPSSVVKGKVRDQHYDQYHVMTIHNNHMVPSPSDQLGTVLKWTRRRAGTSISTSCNQRNTLYSLKKEIQGVLWTAAAQNPSRTRSQLLL